MRIETKFSIGETIFFMHNNKVNSSQISGVCVERHNSAPNRTFYYLKTVLDSRICETYLFKSKEDLMKTL